MSIDPFNVVWWTLLAAIAVVCLLIWLVFRGRSEKLRARVLVLICVFNFLFFWFYKYLLSQDPTFHYDYGGSGGFGTLGGGDFNIWLELPLQLCNINILLIPLALAIRREGLFAFCFYTAWIGALMAITSPPASFVGGSLFLPHNIGFYGMHTLLIVCGVSLATLGFVRPRQRDVLWTALILAIITCAMHGINTLMRQALHVNANYFYTYGSDGSVVLSKLYAILPVPLAYLFLTLPLVIPALMLLTALINLPTKLKRRK
jgi:uncharacterized membrane protein YwaF